MKNWFLMFCMVFSISIISAQENMFDIEGKINETYNGNKVGLVTFDGKKIKNVDSTTAVNGRFVFHGTEYLKETLSMIKVEDLHDEDSHRVILEKGHIQVNIGKDYSEYSVHGTPLNNLYQTYRDSCSIYQKTIDKMLEKGDGGRITETGITVYPGGNLEKVYYKYGTFTVNFKKNNITNVVGQAVFKKELREFRMGELIWSHGTDSAFQIIYNLADEKLKSDPLVLAFLKKQEKDKMSKNFRESLIGKEYFDFSLLSPTNETKQLSDFIGESKFVLIDFWASWCYPCIVSMPALKEIHEKFKDKGLKILGITMDDNKQSWLKALGKIDAPWTHFIIKNRGKESKTKITNSYGLKGIPYSVLIDNKGKIVSVGSFPSDLELEFLLK